MKRTITATPLLLTSMGLAHPVFAFDTPPAGQELEASPAVLTELVPCHRLENQLTVGQSRTAEGWAMNLKLFPRDMPPEPAVSLPDLERPSMACLNPRNLAEGYEDDGMERAELWEPRKARLPFGTDVWYGFSMRVEGEVPKDAGRLVIGQWKQGGGPNADKSPFLAQRLSNGKFHITFQQDGENGDECRVMLAHNAEPPQVLPDSINKQTQKLCFHDVVVERMAPLPSPVNNWLDVVYHIKGSSGPDGLVEVWANGALVARATGRIGYDGGGNQYFKFGPYRDKASYELSVTIESFKRGASYLEVATGLNRLTTGGEVTARDDVQRY